MSILQLRQEQMPSLPFTAFLTLEWPETHEKIAKDENGYVIIHTDLSVQDPSAIAWLMNNLLSIAKWKGYSHLMLKYV